MSLVHNERVKLTATTLNNIAIAAVVAGFVAPVAGVLYGLAAAPASRFWYLVALAWLATGVILHLASRSLLGELRP